MYRRAADAAGWQLAGGRCLGAGARGGQGAHDTRRKPGGVVARIGSRVVVDAWAEIRMDRPIAKPPGGGIAAASQLRY